MNSEKKSNQEHENEEVDEVEEVDDYMSNDFLNQIVDTRPGLVFNRATARKYEVEKKHEKKCQQNKQISIKELEKTKRDEALKTSTLDTANKGFNLMLKMGYKKGEGLGKTSSSETEGLNEPASKKKLLEPISFEIKADREGLGQLTERKMKLEEIERLRKMLSEKKVESEKDTENLYLNSKRSKFNLRKLRFSLHKCQRICYQLDSTKEDLKEPEISWFWPKNIMAAIKEEKIRKRPLVELKPSQMEKNDNNIYTESELSSDTLKKEEAKPEENVEETTDNKSKIDLNKVYQDRLNIFLSQDEKSNEVVKNKNEEEESNEEDLEINIEDYAQKVRLEKEKNEGEDMSDREEEDDNEEDEEDNEEIMSKKVDSICLYLREKYFYCVWCATTYNNENEMSLSCPGPAEKDHEYDE